MNISKLNEIMSRKPVIAGEMLFLAVAGFFAYSHFSAQDIPQPKKLRPAASAAAPAAQTQQVAGISVDFSRNPFGDVSAYERTADDSVAAAGVSLPSVPAIPRGSVPLPSIPGGIPMPGESAAIPQLSASGVQGILTDDSGTSIAILNDGRVVSQGDTYNDGRIAYIGGSGIEFENGDFWSFNDD